MILMNYLVNTKKVDLSVIDIFGNSFLHYASQTGTYFSIVEVDVKNLINHRNNLGNIPLTYAIGDKNQHLALFFMQNGSQFEVDHQIKKMRVEYKPFDE